MSQKALNSINESLIEALKTRNSLQESLLKKNEEMIDKLRAFTKLQESLIKGLSEANNNHEEMVKDHFRVGVVRGMMFIATVYVIVKIITFFIL